MEGMNEAEYQLENEGPIHSQIIGESNQITQIFYFLGGRPTRFMSAVFEWIKKLLSKQFGVETPPEPPGLPQPTAALLNPYKGLRAFEYKDAPNFFGRERLIREMVQQVKDILIEDRQHSQSSHCILIVGSSGAGKSSAVMAGLLPALQCSQDISEIKRWFFLEPVMPGEHPIDALTHALKRPFMNKRDIDPSLLGNGQEEYDTNTSPSPGKYNYKSDGPTQGQVIGDHANVQIHLYSSRNEPESSQQSSSNRNDHSQVSHYPPLERQRKALDDSSFRGLLQRITTRPDDRVVLVIDQFEELFAPTVDQVQREQFIDLLHAMAIEPDNCMLIVVTLRADFYYDYIVKDHRLLEIMKKHRIDISPMTLKELTTVIEKPAKLSGVTFDPDLARHLAHEIHKQPDALPLLQFTLEKLFESREDGHLTRQNYDEIGGFVQTVINRHADDTYNNLPTGQHRECAEELFTKHFIHIMESQDEPSRLESGKEIIRRRVTRADLQLDDQHQAIRRDTIQAFTEARLLTVSHGKQSTKLEDTTYEISHEMLINAWQLLRTWIEAKREDIYLIQRLRPRIAKWKKENRRKKKRELLVKGRELKQLQEYNQRNALNPYEPDFLQQSRHQRNWHRAHNIIIYVITILLVALLVFGAVATFRYIIFPDPSVVTSLSDTGPGSLRQAIEQASSGTTITFAPQLKGQSIHLTSNDLVINKTITLLGGPADGDISITSDNTGKEIHIGPEGDVTFENITFADSYTHKNSIIVNDGILTLNKCEIKNNKSYGIGGGGILNRGILNKGYLNLNDTVIFHNTVSGNGGGIYNLFGTVNVLNNSKITDNVAYNNGGGIYSQGGYIALSHSQVSDNTANNNYGGGINVVNSLLDVSSDSKIDHNRSDYYGGGIAVQGSVAFISDSRIRNNSASAKGGGIVVTKNTDNNLLSLVTLRGITITENPNALHYIGGNTGGNDSDKDIAGKLTTEGAALQISDDDNVGPTGNPPSEENSLQNTPNYLPGVVNIDGFCLNKQYSYAQLNEQVDKNAKDIQFTCFTLGKERSHEFSGQEICQALYPTGVSVVDRLANYFDPTSLQCYQNLKPLGSIGNDAKDFDDYCRKDSQNAGLYDNKSERMTAYDWLCQPKDTKRLPSGLVVAGACNTKYQINNAIDRLVSYNKPDGWECWAPA